MQKSFLHKYQYMFGRGKSKKARSKGSNPRLKEDRISQLPDPLICHILSHLPINEAVSTSALSSGWRSLWLLVPELDLDSYIVPNPPDLDGFVSFGDRFFDSSRVSFIRKLRLDIGGGSVYPFLKSWIDAAVKRKIQHLDLNNLYVYEIPKSIFTSETLVVLKLRLVALPDAEFVSLPCLKTMHLDRILYPNEATFERLVSSCPVLDELKVDVSTDDANSYRVQSRSLKKLTFIRLSTVESVLGAEIDAPLLGCLSIVDHVSNSFLVNNLESIAKLDISLDLGSEKPFAGRSRIRSFLPGIPKVSDMTISADTFKVIHDYSKFEPLPQFCCMSHLHVNDLCVSDLIFLLTFLGSCPNLKSLILGLYDYQKMHSGRMNLKSFSSVPECLLSSLEFLDFEAPFSGYDLEMELVKYFLEHSTILKMLTLHVIHDSLDYDISKKLLKTLRRSATCQVVVSNW